MCIYSYIKWREDTCTATTCILSLSPATAACQYLYFCTSKASKLKSYDLLLRLLGLAFSRRSRRSYSKASKMSSGSQE